MKFLDTAKLYSLIEQALEEQVAYLAALREEIQDAMANGDDALMFEAAPSHQSATNTVGAYRYVLDLMEQCSVEVPNTWGKTFREGSLTTRLESLVDTDQPRTVLMCQLAMASIQVYYANLEDMDKEVWDDATVARIQMHAHLVLGWPVKSGSGGIGTVPTPFSFPNPKADGGADV